MVRPIHNKIDECVDAMTRILDMTILWPLLLQRGIYSRNDDMVSVWEQSLNDRETMREILLTIKTLGPHAYQTLIDCLQEANYISLVDMLEDPGMPSINNNNSEFDDRQNGFERLDDNYSDSEPYDPSRASEPLRVVVRRASEFLDRGDNLIIPRYPMRSRIRGLMLIITLIDYIHPYKRDSAKYDEKNLRDLFQQFDFKVFALRNLTVPEIRKTLKRFVKRKQFRMVDSCFVAFSGHGRRSSSEYQTVIIDKNRQEITVGEILDYFTAERCPNLINKPKVFIYQLCRGENIQRPHPSARKIREKDRSEFKFDNEETQSPIPGEEVYPKCFINASPVRNYEDMLVVHSTLPGHVSRRNGNNGTWFIQILCDVFMKHAHNTHILDLFIMVDQRLKNLGSRRRCQTSTITNIGFKHLFFNPLLRE